MHVIVLYPKAASSFKQLHSASCPPTTSRVSCAPISTSLTPVSGLIGSMYSDVRNCNQCSAHGGSGAEASDYGDVELPHRPYSGTSCARYEPRDPRTRLAGTAPVEVCGKMATDAWVKDSFEACAQLAGGVAAALRSLHASHFSATVRGNRTCNGRENTALDSNFAARYIANENVPEEVVWGADIRLAPRHESCSDLTPCPTTSAAPAAYASPHPAARRVAVAALMCSSLSFARRNGDAEPYQAPSQRSVYYDAQDARAPVSQGRIRSADRSSGVPNTSPSGKDCSADFASARGGFRGPGGSPRHHRLNECQ